MTGKFAWKLCRAFLGKSITEYLRKVASEREFRASRSEAAEMSWRGEVYEWPMIHPEDVSDDNGHRLIASVEYREALDSLGYSFRKVPIVRGDGAPG